MNRQELFTQIKEKRSFLVVGLDTDIRKIPKHLHGLSDDPLFEFNRQIIENTADLCVGYKINLAFFESEGPKGWNAVEKTVNYIRENHLSQFVIADAKRGDIGNTSSLYARTFFEYFNFDAVTVAPYMGSDSVKPFLGYLDKWVILLALTSNGGAADFQYTKDAETGELIYEKVLRISQSWSSPDNMMYVVGATKAESLKEIRRIIPDHFLLIPGVGAQGGNLEEVARNGMNEHCGLLVNSSRAIIYASDGEDFAERARDEALNVQIDMEELLLEAGLL